MTVNSTQRKIIHTLDDAGIDRISIAGIMCDLTENKLNEEDFLDYIKDKKDLCIEDCTDKLWDMAGYY